MTAFAASPDGTEPVNRNERRKARTRARLLAAARDEVARLGLSETSVTDITEAADVAAGSFYNYFNSKDEIISELVRGIVDDLGTMIEAASDDASTPTEALTTALDGLMEWFQTDEQRARFVVRVAASNELLRDSVGLALGSLVQRGVEAGEFDVDPVAATVMIAGGVIAMFDVQTKDLLSSRDAKSAFIELSLRIVRASP